MTDEPNSNSELDARPAEEAAAKETSSDQPAMPEADTGQLQSHVAELQDRLLRDQAELENFRRRTANEAIEARKYQSLDVIRDLLPAIDNLERAVQSAEQTGDVSNLLEGIRMVTRQLTDTLKAHGTELISPEGEAFDPNLHEALSQSPSAEHPPMTVLQVVEKGFRLHDRVVRPARVIVSCPPSAENHQETSSGD